eukprot:GHVU01052904.1.p1 GENE.GHVU01052904.1~~GHVU01052904.1.p1  ORF type:complete len:111 (-),score=2.39 GHVU01052904.1:1100-1432(-)
MWVGTITPHSDELVDLTMRTSWEESVSEGSHLERPSRQAGGQAGAYCTTVSGEMMESHPRHVMSDTTTSVSPSRSVTIYIYISISSTRDRRTYLPQIIMCLSAAQQLQTQ